MEKNKFTWEGFYQSLAKEIIKRYDKNKLWTEKELRDIMKEWLKNDIKYLDLDSVIEKWDDKEDFKNRIDPFTFFANFNRWINFENRKWILEDLNEKFELWFKDINGDYLVPTVNNQNSWYFTPNTEDKDFESLWNLFINWIELENIDWVKWEIKEKQFNEILEFYGIWDSKITMGLFWINPEKYISLDKNTRYYLENRYKIDFKNSDFNFTKYLEIIENKKLIKDWFIKIVGDSYFIIKTKSELIKKADELNNELRNVWISVMDRLKQISSILFWIYLSKEKELIKEEDKYNSEKEYTVEGINRIFENISKECIDKKIKEIFTWTKIDKNFKEYINSFLQKLDVEILSNVWNYQWDLFWDLYERFLSTISDSWNLWEYYTPRHIVDLMVFILKQKWFDLKNDKIYDPTCGTGWFLSYIWQEFKDKEWNEKYIFWTELNSDTHKFAVMNMFFHGDWESNITQQNSLDEKFIKNNKEKFNYVIANPPYWAKWLEKNNILWKNWYKDYFEKNKILKKDLETKTSELLFLQQIFSVLDVWWTAWVIIPEWVNFQSWAAKNIREFLLKNCSEFEVFSLPVWAFMPYTNVKTSFYVFTKKTDTAEVCKSVKFFDIKNDWFSLDKRRRELSWSDILKIKENYWTKKWLELLENNWILYEETIENLEENNFSLSIKKVEKVKDYKWDIVKLGELCEVVTWFSFSSKKFNKQKQWIPVIRIRDIKNGATKDYYTLDEKEEKNDFQDFIVKKDDILIWMDWEFNVWKWNSEDAYLNQRVMKINKITDSKKCLEEYLFLTIQKPLKELENDTYAVTVKHLSTSWFYSLKIPLPPLEEQKKIVSKLEKLWNLWKLSNDLYSVLENIWIEDVFFESEEKTIDLSSNISLLNWHSWKDIEKDKNENILYKKEEEWFPIIKIWTLKNWIIDDNINIIEKETFEKKLWKYYINNWDLLFAWSWTPETSWGPFISKDIWYLNQHIWKIILNKENINKKFLYYYLFKINKSLINKAKWSAWLQHVTDKDFFAEIWTIFKQCTQKQIAKYFHTYFILKDFIKIFSSDDKNNWNIEFLQNKILESFLFWQENENIDIFLNKIENIFEEERYFEEEIVNKTFNKIIELLDLENFKLEKNTEIIQNVLNQEWVEQENVENVIVNLNSLHDFSQENIFAHLKQNLEEVLLEKEFKNWEIFNYELYKLVKTLNKDYLDKKNLFKKWTDEDNFEQSFINFNKHIKNIFDTISKELQNLTNPLSFKFKESLVFPELEKYSSIVLSYLSDEIKEDFVFDYNKLKDNATASKNYIISNDLEKVSEEINEKYYFEKKDILNYYLSLLTKQFVILYWITGIWKSKIASEFPKNIYGSDIYWNYYKHIAIKSGWDDDKDIKWYYDNLEQDYREWEMLNIIKKAIIDRKNPYFVLLDEMNISKVEHYLSDFLSYIETIWNKDNFVNDNEINLYNTEILDYLEEIKEHLEKLVIDNTFWNKYKWDEDNKVYDNLFDIEIIKIDFYKLLSIESKTWLNLIWDLLENNPIFWVNSLIWSYEDKKILENFIKYIKLQLWENIWESWDGSIEDYLNFIEEHFEYIYLWNINDIEKKIQKELNYLVTNVNLQTIVNYTDELSQDIEKPKNVFLFNRFYDFLQNIDIKWFEIKKSYDFEKIWDILDNQFWEIIINNSFDLKLKVFDVFWKPEKNLNEWGYEILFESNFFRKSWSIIIADLIKKGVIVNSELDEIKKEIVLYDVKELSKQEKLSDTVLCDNKLIVQLWNKNYFSDFIYLSDYNFKKSERSKLSKEEQLVDFKNKLIWKVKEGYSIKLSWSHGENKFKNILSLTLKEIENTKFEIWVRIPDNLYITWTINIDETTEWLSPKVIDRANIIEYNKIHLNEDTNELLDFLWTKQDHGKKLELSRVMPFDFKHEPKVYDIKENIWKEKLETELKEQIILLKKIYFITQEANQHFGYRTIEEVLKYLWNFKIRVLEKNNNIKNTSINEYFDIQILQKILPKIGWYNQKTEIVLIEILKALSDNNNTLVSDKSVSFEEKLWENWNNIQKFDDLKNNISFISDQDLKNEIINILDKHSFSIANKYWNMWWQFTLDYWNKINDIKQIVLDELEKLSITNKKIKKLIQEKYNLQNVTTNNFYDLISLSEKLEKLKKDKKSIIDSTIYKKSVSKIINMLENYYQEGKTSYWI